MYGNSGSVVSLEEIRKHEEALKVKDVIAHFAPERVWELPMGRYYLPLETGAEYGVWTGPCTLEILVSKDGRIEVSLTK